MRYQQTLALVPLVLLCVILLLEQRTFFFGYCFGQAVLFLESASARHIRTAHLQHCERLAGDETLQWSAESSKCAPDVCNGAALPDIPDFPGGVPAAFVCSLRLGLFDTQRTRRCLTSKRLVLLGDSTMVDMAHDLIMLLAGLGGNSSAVDGYCLQGTLQPLKEIMHLQVGSAALGLNITFLNAQYHMRIDAVHDNIHVVNKFTGYFSLDGVDLNRFQTNETDATVGIAAFADPRFQPQLACLLGEDPACPAPDLVLVNSGFWDQVHIQNTEDAKSFEPIASALGRRLAALPGKAYWVGTRAIHAWLPFFLGAMGVDAIAAVVLPAAGIPFISIAPTMRMFMPEPGDNDYLMWSPDRLHYGAIGRHDGYNSSLALSSAILQTVLNAVC